MKLPNKYEIGGITSVAFLAAVLLTFVWFVNVKPKLDLCRVYYSELPATSCFMSHYGLPPASRK